jgi:GH25 family lysozyme M1 (1,4-beta-N-acetylmuramidase)
MVSIRGFRWFGALGAAIGFGLLAVTPSSAAMVGLPGIDVSHYQDSPAWATVQGTGKRFVIAKASDGSSWRDPRYTANKQRSEALGIPFGAYHYARPGRNAGDAVTEAHNFVHAAALTGQNLAPVLDLEDNGGLGVSRLTAWVKSWLNEVHAMVGVKATIYTSPSFWKTSMGDSRWFADNGYRLWIAHWGVSQPRVPADNWGGRGWTFWQYDNCGRVAGISGCVDLDRYRGTTFAALRIRNNR